MIRLKRLSTDPVLKPEPNHSWEAAAVFNGGAVYDKGKYHYIYRATDIGGHERYGKYINSFGYASSTDLIHWDRLSKPILSNDVPQELRGPEDPRIAKIDDTFYMTYTGFGGRFSGDYRICMATSKDLIHWERQGVLLDEENKNSAFFPKKFGDTYFFLHRRHPDIWIAETKDFKSFKKHEILMKPINDDWQNTRIGIAGPPVPHPEGFLLFYHAVDETNAYRLGVALLDGDNPRRVLARQSRPVIEPELDWEINGFVPNVIFSCATVKTDSEYIVIYAGADTVTGVASIKISDTVFEKSDWLV